MSSLSQLFLGKRRMYKLGMIIALAALSTLSFARDTNNKVIYGADDRLDLYEVTNTLHLELAKSTAGMIDSSKITIEGDLATITGPSLKERGMCESERFSEQMTAANCSGFLVGEDLLVTAGHCMTSADDCASNKWVFGYANNDANTEAAMTVDASNVYGCSKIISQSLDRSSQDDFALIRLDRKVTDRTPLTVRTTGKIEDKTPIVVIGHPTGLPTKVAAGANVRSNDSSVFFIANLDTYGGNSGSAVFNAETGVVEGILVRGENDYNYDYGQGCRVSNHCTDEGCRGEDVTRITNIQALMDILGGNVPAEETK
ncbi:MAG: peptidase [Halobacteriovorax sp.]|nr:peptidase [Halobacteriovorax sp.]